MLCLVSRLQTTANSLRQRVEVPGLVLVALWLLLTLASTLLVASADHALGLQYAWLAKPLVEGALAGVSFLLLRYVVYR